MFEEENLPAFSMWKMFSDTVPGLLRIENSESCIIRIAQIITSKEYSSIFVYMKEPSLSFTEYQEVSDKYKAFTVWLLGRLFHMLSCDNLSNTHKIIIEAQLSILDQISNALVHVYKEFCDNYLTAFNLMTNYLRNEDTTLQMNLFKPKLNGNVSVNIDLSTIPIEVSRKEECCSLLLKTLEILEFILNRSFLFQESQSGNICQSLEDLIFLLTNCDEKIKIKIFKIYVSLLKHYNRRADDDFYPILDAKMRKLFSLTLQLTCDVYKNVIHLDSNNELAGFEESLEQFLEECHKKRINLVELTSIASLLVGKTTVKVSESVERCCVEILRDYSSTHNSHYTLHLNSILKENYNLDFSIFEFNILTDITTYYSNSSGVKVKYIEVFNSAVSKMWSDFHESFLQSISSNNGCQVACISRCLKYLEKITDMIMRISIKFYTTTANNDVCLIFFSEPKLFYNILSRLQVHFKTCTLPLEHGEYLHFFTNLPLLTNSKNRNILFHLLCQPFLISITRKKVQQFPDHFVGTADKNSFKNLIREFYKFSLTNGAGATEIMNYVIAFLKNVTFEFTSKFESKEMEEIGNSVYLIMKNCSNSNSNNNNDIFQKLLECLPYIICILNDQSNEIGSQIILPSITSTDPSISEAAIKILPNLLCMSCNGFIKVLAYYKKTKEATTRIFCNKCSLKEYEDTDGKFMRQRFLKDYYEDHEALLVIKEFNTEYITGLSDNTNVILRHILPYLTSERKSIRLAALGTLPSFSNHAIKFHAPNIVKIWIDKAGDPDKDVRCKLSDVIESVMKFLQENPLISENVKKEVWTSVLETLLELTKKSLKYSDYELQDTLLETIEEVSSIRNDDIVLPLMKILFYFIMVPTSKYSLIAVNKFYVLAEKHETNTELLYLKYKKELCSLIVDLCVVNQTIINYDLSKSLSKVSLVLGFLGTKDFIGQGYQYLLPYFVVKVINNPEVSRLIEEVATLLGTEVSDLLANKYGNIFLSVFLNETKDDVKKCLSYLEKVTGMSGPTLRKRNSRILLNELLLNFYEKKDRVLAALGLLAREDTACSTNDIREYLQSQFLGILQFFDVKLLDVSTKNDKVLQSLAEIFRYMGPKHISPSRFKIIAMLRTPNYNRFPELLCEVWSSFIESCDIEVLCSQLATIFVSLLPLLKEFPLKVNNMFTYLLIQNESYVADSIKDLFFVDNSEINMNILAVIKKHCQGNDDLDLRDKMKFFIKYLTHETMEVRIKAMKHMKELIEKNREDLDRMILGYNGVDPVVVELIDILTVCSREKDESLMLACGELIGELGAVEPSHLPRRYAQDTKLFTFFMYEDGFIESSLSELIKGLQAEKNTQNMDRFSLAIQEILKTYDISPDETSSKNCIWKKFSESQQEVMKPMLSSKYMISAQNTPNFPSPIYGSQMGASFQTWLYNWLYSLISSLPNERSALLNFCLPCIKQDNRILMHYLPLVILHALIESNEESEEKIHVEIETITSSMITKRKVSDDVLNVRPIPIPGMVVSVTEVTGEDMDRMQCIKVVFIVLDFLNRWIREWQWLKGLDGRSDNYFRIVKNFLNKFCKLQLAKCNYRCGEFPRALMYLEDYINLGIEDRDNQLPFLAEIYAQLDEPDGVAGVTALQQAEPLIEQRILSLEISGKLADAAACYETIPSPLKLNHLQGMMQCYLDLDNVNTAYNFAQGAIDLTPEFGNMLLEMQAEPLWRLGRYEDLSDLVKKPEMVNNKSWGVQIGKSLLSIKNGERDNYRHLLDTLKTQQIEHFGAASLEEGAYQHGYGYIAKLHALNELEQVERAINELLIKPNDPNSIKVIMDRLMTEWNLRLKVVQESVRIIEPLLCLRRVTIELAKRVVEGTVPLAVPYLNSLLGELWLRSAKTARAAGVHQQAYTYTLKAEEYAPPRLFLEKAKLQWMREEHQQALMTLRRGADLIMPAAESQRNADSLNLEQRKICAEARLLIASYNESISNVGAEVNLDHFRQSVEIFKEWEKSFVYLGQYYDRLFKSVDEKDRDSKRSNMQLTIIRYLGKSLSYGTAYVYQSMPRLLSIWFDYGTRLLDVNDSAVKEERKTVLLKMTKLIDSYLERLPSFIFLTAFSQLVSRICHPQREVYIELKSIIIKLIVDYPQQSLWMLISVIKSGYENRSKRCAEILNDPKLKTIVMAKVIKDFTTLAERLIELCNKPIADDVKITSVNTLLRTLPRLLSKGDFSEIMMPTHKFRKLVLPNPDFKNTQHNPFPNHYVHIAGIDDKVTVLQSLQRPRKISLRGSDGKNYVHMLKPKDDLRLDFRLMEFNDIVNQLLSQDPEARQRRLNIRLYSVAPLNEECGIIEWIPNLSGFRPILIALYKQRGIAMKAKELKEASCRLSDPLAKKREVFNKVFLPRHPPLLSEWFRKTFPDAQNWLTARTAYIRTTAVMSIVGYILGLGDRHGENISLDSICGDIVHVDFNCLFNKGETFEWPERVPFRLTHNMVTAMGPLGVEGLFRKACACTLNVLRANTATLMSVVTPFVYDPLVKPTSRTSNTEATNEKALEHIKNIELRLTGIMKSEAKLLDMPLSVEGQVNNLINDATSVDNLCQMYIGWGAFL